MDGKPFKVRTFYFGEADSGKKTLILTHGFLDSMLSFFSCLKLISQHYRVIGFDNLSWGLNTRLKEHPGVHDP